MPSDRRTTRGRFPMGWLSIGLVLGAIYGTLDTAMDASLLEGHSQFAFDVVHRFLNLVAPPVAGMVVGMLFAYMRQREALVDAERRVSEALRERIKGAERQQAVWLVASSLLHDIRNPLHALGLLLDEATERKGDPNAVDEAVARALAQAERIDQRIGSLRELAECPPRQRARVSIPDLIESVVADLRELAGQRDVRLEVGQLTPLEVEADAKYLRVPLENLVVNAMDACEGASMSKTPVVHVDMRAGPQAAILIRDTGTGVPQDAQQAIFEPLRSAKRTGLGLGLPLARALARLEGADVRLLKNGPPETVFALMLPDRQSED